MILTILDREYFRWGRTGEILPALVSSIGE